LLAILTYLLLVVVFNKSICGWACQFGMLKDLLFRIRWERATVANPRQPLRVPFLVSNTVRVLFSATAVLLSLFWAFDLMRWLNPFLLSLPPT
jgi:hypothetical protein